MSLLVRVVLGVSVLGLAGCEEYRVRRDAVVAEHGNAVAHNIAVHTIDPWPPASRKTRIDIDGERIQIGVERYKANRSIEPRGLATQRVISTSGGTAP